ncbi:vasotab-like [Lycorma delicatula]|uniref:vasotab-like n=1 Tax=Lycorma delicatula TaxID=130591 RepID=UPI003F50EEE2
MNSKIFTLTVLLVTTFSFLSPAESKKCQTYCPLMYRPLCAINSRGCGKTFGNSCELGVFNCVNNESYVKIKNGIC